VEIDPQPVVEPLTVAEAMLEDVLADIVALDAKIAELLGPPRCALAPA
jgi:hypothetical protein